MNDKRHQSIRCGGRRSIEEVSTAKHVLRRHFYVRELVENLQVSVPFVRTHENLADFFTKPLLGEKFFEMRDAIMNVRKRHE